MAKPQGEKGTLGIWILNHTHTSVPLHVLLSPPKEHCLDSRANFQEVYSLRRLQLSILKESFDVMLSLNLEAFTQQEPFSWKRWEGAQHLWPLEIEAETPNGQISKRNLSNVTIEPLCCVVPLFFWEKGEERDRKCYVSGGMKLQDSLPTRGRGTCVSTYLPSYSRIPRGFWSALWISLIRAMKNVPKAPFPMQLRCTQLLFF